MKTYFSTNSSFRLVETYFLSSGNTMLSFRSFFLMLVTIIEIRWNHFLWFSCQKKQFFCIMEKYFSTNASFRLMETNFLACSNNFLYVFRDYCQRKLFFLSSGNVFVNEPFIPAIGEGFFSLVEHVTLFERVFLLSKTDIMSWDQFLNTELILAGGNSFSG